MDNKEEKEILTFPVFHDGMIFLCKNDTSLLDKTEGGEEKRRVIEIVASGHDWNDVLDAYGGAGISSFIYSKYAKRVSILEQDFENCYFILENVLYRRKNVRLTPTDNLLFLKEAVENGKEPPDLIDIDPFGNPEPQLSWALRWIKKGAILITNALMIRIQRGHSAMGKVYQGIGKRYSGRAAVLWAEDYYIPMLKEQYKDKELNPVYFYAHPTSVRVVCEVGGFKFSSETMNKLKKEPTYLDWFEDVHYQKGESHDRNKTEEASGFEARGTV